MFCPKPMAKLDNDIGKALPKLLCNNRLEGKPNQIGYNGKNILLTKYGCTTGVNDEESVSVVVEREDERDASLGPLPSCCHNHVTGYSS
jgi:hypothetical protein